MTGALVVVSPDGKVILTNRAAAGLLGLKGEELINRHAAEVLPPEMTVVISEILKRGEIRGVERTVTAKDGKKVPLLFSGILMRSDGGRPVATVLAAQDISGQRLAEEKIKVFSDAVAGAFDAGAEAVLVNDAHWYMNNLQIEKLDRRVRLVSGHNKPRSMMFGIDGLYAAAFFVGYHAAAGAQAAVLNHTMIGRQLLNVYVNGEVAGETRLNAALAGHHGVPVALVTGDDAVCEEAKRLLGDVETVAVKEGIDKYTANLVAPEIAQQRIREAATNAAKRAGELKPYVVEPPVTLGVDWNSTTIAAACEMIPGTKLAGPREVEYTANEFPEALDVLEVMLYIASQIVERPDTYD